MKRDRERTVSLVREHGVNDLVSGEVYVSYGKLRWVLGQCCGINRFFHRTIIDELIAVGLLERVNRRTLRVVTK